MSADIAELIQEIRKQELVPFENRLWGAEHIAEYLNRSKRVVIDRITKTPGFPEAIQLKVRQGKGMSVGQPLWKAKEVIAWVEGHRKRGKLR